ncbi:L,D-transpeptidase [Neobacillus niacini]|uniref:L,D-transpeptidase family protein n=1 Tax=Neobacillus niacini TaxID=86668 RepID=UPI001C8DDDC4|nr:L,D-transpeptidase [Neobacillus niacini]
MSTANARMEESDKKADHIFKRISYPVWIAIGIIIVIGLILGGISYYQATQFNANVMINSIKVGGLSANQALTKLQSVELKNAVYIGQQPLLDEKDTPMGFTDKDLTGIKKLLKNQWTFFPSSKEKEYSLIPKEMEQYRSETLPNLIEDKLKTMNEGLKAPQDAYARLEQGKIVIIPSVNGEKYDVSSVLKDYQKQKYSSEIHLNPSYIQPNKKDSPVVKNQEKKLQEFLQHTVDYKVQDKVYSLKASDLILNASLSSEMQVTIEASNIQNKITEINNAQSTLNKDFTFKTHSGSVISVKGKGFGWALKPENEALRIQEAFEKGETSIEASNLHGNGWDWTPIGYERTTNNGIGDTYAEVSLAQQRIWIYKNGKLAVTTHVVTGKRSTGEDTHPGVWYILYKKSPSVLRGTAVGKGSYEQPVNYWAPFTNDGQGFHDAGWRSNWASNAYNTAGSAGCVNVPPSVMASIYNNLSQYDPVIIY